MGTFDKYLQLADKTYFNRLGKVTKIVGLTIESVGPNAKLMICAVSLSIGNKIFQRGLKWSGSVINIYS